MFVCVIGELICLPFCFCFCFYVCRCIRVCFSSQLSGSKDKHTTSTTTHFKMLLILHSCLVFLFCCILHFPTPTAAAAAWTTAENINCQPKRRSLAACLPALSSQLSATVATWAKCFVPTRTAHVPNTLKMYPISTQVKQISFEQDSFQLWIYFYIIYT